MTAVRSRLSSFPPLIPHDNADIQNESGFLPPIAAFADAVRAADVTFAQHKFEEKT